MSTFTSCSEAGRREGLKEVLVGLIVLQVVGPSSVLVWTRGSWNADASTLSGGARGTRDGPPATARGPNEICIPAGGWGVGQSWDTGTLWGQRIPFQSQSCPLVACFSALAEIGHSEVSRVQLMRPGLKLWVSSALQQNAGAPQRQAWEGAASQRKTRASSSGSSSCAQCAV